MHRSELDQHITSPVTGAFDIASTDDQSRVRLIADELVQAQGIDLDDFDGSRADPLDLRVAVKLARSKRAVLRTGWTGTVAVVFAMWGESRRLRPRSADNPTGEDALHVKLDQLDWLFAESAIDWTLVPVDDGDPEDSADVAEDRAAAHDRGGHVRVLRLATALPASHGPLAGLESVDDSRKGGAIIHGAHVSVEAGADAVVMTDADNSVNLGQIGLLVEPFATGAGAVIGDRKHPNAVLVKAEARWGPGIVALRHMQRMVGRALFSRGLRDTQAAFKLYGRAALEDILAAPSTYGFAFDSDWLYACIAGGHDIASVPFAFIDSFEESASITQGPMTTWESLLRGLTDAARARGVDHDEEMAAVVDACADAATLERVVQAVPPELEGVADADLGDPNVMAPARLREWIESLQSSKT